MNALVDFWTFPDGRLFHMIESDDIVLQNSAQAVWYESVKTVFEEWPEYVPIATGYYEAQYQFNQNLVANHEESKNRHQQGNESKQEARQRLLFQRPTGGNEDASKLFQTLMPPETTPSVNINAIRPGQVPCRLAGRKPKDFFSMFAAFMGTQTMEMESSPENVHNNLTGNPSFARACNFTQPCPGIERQTDIPSLRKIEQFDQIMTENGLWSQGVVDIINRNLDDKTVVPERNVVHDTTHHLAFSGFETVEYLTGKDKKKRKSQSHVTKNCTCADKDRCEHPWVLADDGAGTVVKHHCKFFWAHKASIIGLPDQGVPLIAQAMADASTHDSGSVVESLNLLNERFPHVLEVAKNVLDDSAADDPKLKALVQGKFGIQLRCTVNPRRRKTLKHDELPKGMASLTPTGVLRCQAGHEMDYRGFRCNANVYSYGPPYHQDQQTCCDDCALKSACCHRDNAKGRHVTIACDLLPHILPNDPPMAKRFQKLMKKRPAVERMIYRIKCVLGDRYLSKRGNHNYQAALDKAMLAFHMLLRLL